MQPADNSTTYKNTSDKIQQAELGRRYASTPEEHLKHLLAIGWTEESLLIQRFRRKYGLINNSNTPTIGSI
jgi:hypothetical protein